MRRWEDKGAYLEAPLPVRLKRYKPGRLPNAAECVDCLIVVNDDSDSVPRARLALSNGASWDYIGYVVDAVPAAAPSTALVVQPSAPREIDLTPLVRAAVDAALPAMIPPPVKVVEQITQSHIPSGDEVAKLREHVKVLAAANLELSEHLHVVLRQFGDLEARVDYIERNALAKAEIAA
jgi:hypothetical protein